MNVTVAVPTGLVSTLTGIIQKFLMTLKALEEEKANAMEVAAQKDEEREKKKKDETKRKVNNFFIVVLLKNYSGRNF